MNKLLIKVYVPYIAEEYDVFIPINKKIGTIKILLINAIKEIAECSELNINTLKIYDKITGKKLDNNILVKDSNLENGSKLILL